MTRPQRQVNQVFMDLRGSPRLELDPTEPCRPKTPGFYREAIANLLGMGLIWLAFWSRSEGRGKKTELEKSSG